MGTFFKRFTTESYYKFLAFIGVQIVYNHADYRLMGLRAVESLRSYHETDLFLCVWCRSSVTRAPSSSSPGRALRRRTEISMAFREAAKLYTPQSQNVLISAHRDGSFVFDMRTMSKRRDIGVWQTDKFFMEINIMRQLGIKDQHLDQKGTRAILDDQHIAVVAAHTGYPADQRSMQAFRRVLMKGGSSGW